MKDVTVFTSSTCHFCKLAKDFLKEKGIEYKEKNINEDKEAKMELMSKGYAGVPVIVIDGEEFVGFNEAKLTEALNK